MQNCFKIEFGKFYCQLPSYVQKQADRAFEHFAYDARYPSLEFKCVNQQQSKYSIRINRKGYRALGHVIGNDVYWYWIGPHDQYERRVREMIEHTWAACSFAQILCVSIIAMLR